MIGSGKLGFKDDEEELTMSKNIEVRVLQKQKKMAEADSDDRRSTSTLVHLRKLG